MKQRTHFWLTSAIALVGLLVSSPVIAQVIPDATLLNNSSVTTDGKTSTITGGTQAGGNLFHSFEQFSIPTGGTAFFNNAADIQNIFSRVTGSMRSNIDGLIQANGAASLFLLNPNGIIFGPNARLNIGGSFLASTASSLNFADSTQFSATMPQSTPLLSVSVPVGLQYGKTAAGIQVQQTILQVQAGQTLALVGGNVGVEGGEFGFLEALGGRIELGGLASAGTVEIKKEETEGAFRLSSLQFPDAVERGNVLLTNYAFVDVASGGKGSIAINANSLELAGESTLNSGIASGLGSGNTKAGNIDINALVAVNLKDESLIFNDVQSKATGQGGNISITTDSLAVSNGAQLSASNLGRGKAGSITITASDRVSFDGVDSSGNPSGAFSNVEAGAEGKGGSISITAGSLVVTNGARLYASTLGQGDAGNITIFAQDTVSFDQGFIGNQILPGAVGKGGSISITTGSLSLTNGAQLLVDIYGRGDAGSVNINAQNSVFFDGFDSNGNPSGAFSSVEFGGIGKGGNISITTGSLSLANGAQLFASSRGQGDAGSVNINAHDTISFDGVSSKGNPSAAFSSVESGGVGKGGSISITTGSLSLTNGAQLLALTREQGDAGSVNINARDTISFDGVSSNGKPSGAFSSVESGAVGNGGGIDISTRSLSITNGAGLSTSSKENGTAGNIEVAADSIRLNNQATISSDTTAGQGDILLNAQNLVLRHGSNITTDAVGTATGGNIDIDTGVLAALENSDISANAQNARGGRVIIDVQGIFGTEFRKNQTPQSDITATSELGSEFSGIVDINTLGIEPITGTVNLPTVPVDTEVAQTCTPGGNRQQSEFVVTGRGGLPPSPNDALSSDAISVNWVTLNPDIKNHSSPADVSTKKTDPTPAPIVEAQGWVMNDNGDIVLTATPVTATPSIPWLTAANCQTVKTRS